MIRIAIIGLGIMVCAAALQPLLQDCNAQVPDAAKHTVSGFVSDVESGEFLFGAHVYDPDRRLGTTSNTYGFFSLTLPSDSATLVISYVGYAPRLYELYLTDDMQLNVALTPSNLLADSITVVVERAVPIEEDVRMSTIRVSVAQIQSIPSFLGEVDPLRSLQLLPGVQSGSEAASGLFVRGGSGDQTLLLLDGARVYNAHHLFGFFSVFNSDALKHIELIKGGFPARYGGTLASVVEIGMKEGNLKRFAGQGAIGAVASRLLVEGPIVKDKASFIVSGRRTYMDLLARPFMKEEILGFNFYDLNAKINGQVSPKDRLYLSIYNGSDNFSFRDDNEWTYKGFLRWGNITSTARWNRLISDKLFSNVTATFSDYTFRIGSDLREDDGDYNKSRYVSGIREAQLKADLDYIPSPDHYIRFGVSASRQRFNSGARTNEGVSYDDYELEFSTPRQILLGTYFAMYTEDEITLGPQLKINAGIRLAAFSITRRVFKSIEPRLSVRYLLPIGWAIKGSYARMQQYIFLLHNSGVELPTDLWLPVTSKVPPQAGHIVAIGAARSLSGGRYELSAESYYRTMTNQAEYKNGAQFLTPGEDWQDKVEIGKGDSYGAEFLVRKQAGRTTGWVGYTLSWTYRQFDNLNGGNRFPYKYDRRHDFSAVLTRQLKPGLELSGLWIFSTGAAVTLPTTVYRSWTFIHACNDCVIEASVHRNDYRMRGYHRLDLGLNFIRNIGQNERTISIGVYNAYNRKNPYYLFWDEEDGEDVLKQFSLLPIVPYITYRRTF